MSYEKKKVLILLSCSLLVVASLIYIFRQPSKNKIGSSSENESEETSNAKYSISIINGSKDSALTAKVEKGSSLLKLFEKLRKDGKLSYEITNYTYGEVLEELNGVKADEDNNTGWNLYINGLLVKEKFKNIKLEEGNKYEFRYEKNN